jgi:hypothetical protein
MESLKIHEIIERFEYEGTTQSFTYKDANSIMSCLSGIEANHYKEYTFLCLDENQNFCFHSVDSIKGFKLHVGGYIFSL